MICKTCGILKQECFCDHIEKYHRIKNQCKRKVFSYEFKPRKRKNKHEKQHRTIIKNWFFDSRA